jgi:hypothetical protein
LLLIERGIDIALVKLTAASPTCFTPLRALVAWFSAVLTACCAAEMKLSKACVACSALF